MLALVRLVSAQVVSFNDDSSSKRLTESGKGRMLTVGTSEVRVSDDNVNRSLSVCLSKNHNG